MPRLSERQQVAHLLRATRPPPDYPPLSASLALHAVPAPVYASWTSGRRRLWDRRHLHPAAYLYSYLPPFERPRPRKFSPAEHVLFLAALRLVPPVSAPAVPNHQWARLAVLLPGRVGSECRRYFHRIGRAGFISLDGSVKHALVCRAKVYAPAPAKHLRSPCPVFLRRNLRKFIPKSLPDLDDAMLRAPPAALTDPASQNELLTYRPPKPSQLRTPAQAVVPHMAALPVAPVQPRSKLSAHTARSAQASTVAPRTKRKKKKNTEPNAVAPVKKHPSPPAFAPPKTTFPTTAVSALASIPPSSKKPPLPKPSGSKRRHQSHAAGGPVRKLSKATVLKQLVRMADPNTIASKADVKNIQSVRSGKAVKLPAQRIQKIDAVTRSSPGSSRQHVRASNEKDKPIFLNLRIKKFQETQPNIDKGPSVTVINPSGNSKSTNIITHHHQAASCDVNKLKINHRVGRAHDLAVNACQSDVLVVDGCSKQRPTSTAGQQFHASAEVLHKTCADFKPLETRQGERLSERRITPQKNETVRDTSQQLKSEVILDRRQSSKGSTTGIQASENPKSSGQPAKFSQREEPDLPSSILLPSSRRMYGPSKSKSAPSEAPTPIEELHSLSNVDVMEDSSDTRYVATMDHHEGEPSCLSLSPEEVFSQASPDSVRSIAERLVQAGRTTDCLSPLQPKDLLVSPLEPFHGDETISLVDACETLSNDKPDVSSEDSKLDRDPPPEAETAVESKRKGSRICEEEFSGSSSGNKRTSIDFLLCSDSNQFHFDRLQKKQTVQENKTIELSGVEYHCCDYCSHGAIFNKDDKLFEVSDSGSPEGTRSWSLPRMGVTWTRAWAECHWSTSFLEHELREAESRFATMHEQAQGLHEFIKLFVRMTEDTTLFLRHKEERCRLLRCFEAMHGTLLQDGHLLIRPVKRSRRAIPGVSKPKTNSSELGRWAPEHFLSMNFDLRYSEMITVLQENWRSGMADFVQRLEEMETRQAMEILGSDSIRSVTSM